MFFKSFNIIVLTLLLFTLLGCATKYSLKVNKTASQNAATFYTGDKNNLKYVYEEKRNLVGVIYAENANIVNGHINLVVFVLNKGSKDFDFTKNNISISFEDITSSQGTINKQYAENSYSGVMYDVPPSNSYQIAQLDSTIPLRVQTATFDLGATMAQAAQVRMAEQQNEIQQMQINQMKQQLANQLQKICTAKNTRFSPYQVVLLMNNCSELTEYSSYRLISGQSAGINIELPISELKKGKGLIEIEIANEKYKFEVN